jgi:hypothetical protein
MVTATTSKQVGYALCLVEGTSKLYGVHQDAVLADIAKSTFSPEERGRAILHVIRATTLKYSLVPALAKTGPIPPGLGQQAIEALIDEKGLREREVRILIDHSHLSKACLASLYDRVCRVLRASYQQMDRGALIQATEDVQRTLEIALHSAKEIGG